MHQYFIVELHHFNIGNLFTRTPPQALLDLPRQAAGKFI
ncbi:hypothetical protein PCIT_a2573 [Pseudoalteromonas citrea]|uniref:Uncharacterized protein n=1 Tax=Pseudoalteromonas citrea TaxID=43655 RepID=A0AAD4FRC8_9GAMM|nr:hypothetical protein PCIT_a2573 [Pseudoalteromonas citrea]